MIDIAPAIHTQPVTHSRVAETDFDKLVFGKTMSDHMFITDYRDGQWQEARIVPYGNIAVSPALSALHYGQSIFEGMKAYYLQDSGVGIFRPVDNLRRLNLSAERMCMPTLPEDLFMQGLTSLIRLDRQWVPSNPGCSLYIRPFMFATDEFLGVRAALNYSFMIITSPVGIYYTKPLRVKIETHYARSCAGGTGFAKSAGNYGGALYPSKLAQQQGYDQLLWTDSKDHRYFEESGTMNVMFVINDTLITPPTGDTILKGITRDSVLQLARDWGMRVEERRISVDEVLEAIQAGTLQEAFGVGTAVTIAHIATIGHEDTDYQLPDVAQRTFAHRVLHALDAIKTGADADPHGWVYRV